MKIKSFFILVISSLVLALCVASNNSRHSISYISSKSQFMAIGQIGRHGHLALRAAVEGKNLGRGFAILRHHGMEVMIVKVKKLTKLRAIPENAQVNTCLSTRFF